MSIKGFDFSIDTNGELILNDDTHDINVKTEDELRLQLAYDRIKSVSNNWFIDNIGANLESLIGKPCNQNNAETGKQLIIQQLTYDNLWDINEFHIKANIISMNNIEYNIYFKLRDDTTEDTYSYEIVAVIDLVKGVHIRYGWEPRK